MGKNDFLLSSFIFPYFVHQREALFRVFATSIRFLKVSAEYFMKGYLNRSIHLQKSQKD